MVQSKFAPPVPPSPNIAFTRNDNKGNGFLTVNALQFLQYLWSSIAGGSFGSPSGTVVFYASGDDPPVGWLICDGSAISRTTYITLFAVIGTSWGVGDGSTTFNIPDLRDRFILGASLTHPNATLGGNSSVTLGTAQLPAHNHGVTDPGHTHAVLDPTHTHTVTDPHHTHTVTDPTHTHGITDAGHSHIQRVVNSAADGTSGVRGSNTTDTTNEPGSTASVTTGVTVNAASTGVTNNSAATGVTNNAALTGVTNASATTGVTTQNTGSGTPVNILPPFAAIIAMIKI